MCNSRKDKPRERWTEGQTEGQTDGETDESDFIGGCPTNIERLIEKFFKSANNNRHI